MFEEREIFAALVAVAVAVFAFGQRDRLGLVPGIRLLLVVYGLIAFSLVCSVVEDLAWKPQINLVQHIASGVAATVMAGWALVFLRPEQESPRP